MKIPVSLSDAEVVPIRSKVGPSSEYPRDPQLMQLLPKPAGFILEKARILKMPKDSKYARIGCSYKVTDTLTLESLLKLEKSLARTLRSTFGLAIRSYYQGSLSLVFILNASELNRKLP